MYVIEEQKSQQKKLRWCKGRLVRFFLSLSFALASNEMEWMIADLSCLVPSGEMGMGMGMCNKWGGGFVGLVPGIWYLMRPV